MDQARHLRDGGIRPRTNVRRAIIASGHLLLHLQPQREAKAPLGILLGARKQHLLDLPLDHRRHHIARQFTAIKQIDYQKISADRGDFHLLIVSSTS